MCAEGAAWNRPRRGRLGAMGLLQTLRRGFDTAVRRARRTGVGTEDPNLVGNPGPVDVAGARDADLESGLFAKHPEDHPDHIET